MGVTAVLPGGMGHNDSHVLNDLGILLKLFILKIFCAMPNKQFMLLNTVSARPKFISREYSFL